MGHGIPYNPATTGSPIDGIAHQPSRGGLNPAFSAEGVSMAGPNCLSRAGSAGQLRDQGQARDWGQRRRSRRHR